MKRFERSREDVYDYASVVPGVIDGIGREHAVVKVPRYYKDAGTILCQIHLPITDHQRWLECKLSDQHFKMGRQADRIKELEDYITGMGVAVEMSDAKYRADAQALLNDSKELLEEALLVHIYNQEDGETPPPDCQFVQLIARLQRFLSTIPIPKAPQ